MPDCPTNRYPNTTELVHLFIETCEECRKPRPITNGSHPVRPILSESFGSRGRVDLVDMQACADGDFCYVGNCQDKFSKFNILFALKSKRAVEVAHNHCLNYCCYH
jgi:hypothetical protein